MKTELNTKTLGEICDQGGGEVKTGPFGSQLNQSDYVDDGIPVVMPKNIIDGKVSEDDIARVAGHHVERLSQYKLSVGDIIYGRRGDIGRHALITDKEQGWLCGTGCLRITLGDDEVDPFFLHYYLEQEGIKKWILNQAIGATMPNLNTSILRSVPIIYPKKAVQRKIASILSAYDDLIENNLRRIKILEEMAQNLYREWFVKFRFPGYEQVRMVDSPLGKIPEGWEVVPFGNVSLNYDRKRKPLSKMQREKRKGVYPYYGAARIFDYIDDYLFDGIYLLVAEDGSVITSDRRPVLQYVNGKFWANNHTHIVQGKGDVSTEYLYLMLSELDISGYITGAAQPKITQTNLNRIPVLIADCSLLNRFNKLVSVLFRQITVLDSKNEILRQTRDLLLPKLISGELDVSQLNSAIKEEAA